MNIKTKYSLNGQVYVITQDGYDEFIPCETEWTPNLTRYQLWQLEVFGYYLPDSENEDEQQNKTSSTEQAQIYLNENPPNIYDLVCI